MSLAAEAEDLDDEGEDDDVMDDELEDQYESLELLRPRFASSASTNATAAAATADVCAGA